RFPVSNLDAKLNMPCSSKIRHQLAQVHFCVSRLEAAFHRNLHSSLVLRSAHTFEEEIGVALNVIGRSESDGVDSIFNDGLTGSRKTGNPMRERSDEFA